MSVRVIAEVGENHLGDMSRALEMVRLASASGADFVKFQSYSEYDLAPTVDEDTRSWIRKTQLSEDDHFRLKAEAERCGITFLSTAVNIRWAAFLRDVGLGVIKLASLSLVNLDLLRFAGENFDEVFMSTGMGSVEEIEQALHAVGNKAHVTLLHCVSEYPTSDVDASLKSIRFLRERFPDSAIGYSDHTIGTVACIAAVALGAKLIEKHFTLDKSLEGSDHILSADPAEMAAIAHGCRRVGNMLGEFKKQPTAGELENSQIMRFLFVNR